MPRRFPPPWTVERIEGGYKVLDAQGSASPKGEPNTGVEGFRSKRLVMAASSVRELGMTRPRTPDRE